MEFYSAGREGVNKTFAVSAIASTEKREWSSLLCGTFAKANVCITTIMPITPSTQPSTSFEDRREYLLLANNLWLTARQHSIVRIWIYNFDNNLYHQGCCSILLLLVQPHRNWSQSASTSPLLLRWMPWIPMLICQIEVLQDAGIMSRSWLRARDLF